MRPRLTRLLVTIAAATLVLLGTVTPASAAPAPCDGVWVVVQPDQKDAATATATCATEHSTGLAALKSAGFSAEVSGTMLARIDGLPKDADFNANGGYYWSYWSAPVAADGSIGTWEYYQVGPDVSKPEAGKAEGWLLTNEQNATGPAVKAVPEAAAPTPPAAPPSDQGSPIGAIVAGTVVVLALIGLGGWWIVRRRRG
nr:transmembrane domain-containing protein [Propionicimonas sp.]